jgi:hypothetical protein
MPQKIIGREFFAATMQRDEGARNGPLFSCLHQSYEYLFNNFSILASIIVIHLLIFVVNTPGMKSRVTEAKISSLIPDDLNANSHSEYGMHLLEKSISELGLGRSIVVDKNNRIIGGNAVVETASALGLENVIIVPTDGKQLVVVKREDVDLDTKRGRELALADNSVAHVNLEWDAQVIDQIRQEWEVDPTEWAVTMPDAPGISEEEKEKKKEISTILIVDCVTAQQLSDLFDELQDRGFKVTLKE